MESNLEKVRQAIEIQQQRVMQLSNSANPSTELLDILTRVMYLKRLEVEILINKTEEK